MCGCLFHCNFAVTVKGSNILQQAFSSYVLQLFLLFSDTHTQPTKKKPNKQKNKQQQKKAGLPPSEVISTIKMLNLISSHPRWLYHSDLELLFFERRIEALLN